MSDEPDHTAGETVRVFLVDDHEIVRQSVRDLLTVSGGIEVVGEDSRAATAARSILRTKPDVAVVDLHLDDGSGIEVCRAVRSEDIGIALLILTADEVDQAALAVALAGAQGYVLKLVLGGRLVATVRDAAASGRRMGRAPGAGGPGPGETGAGEISRRETSRALDRLRHEHARDLNRLTSDEACVLELIGEGLVDHAIATVMELSVAEVAHHVSTLLGKLGFPSRANRVDEAPRRDLFSHLWS